MRCCLSNCTALYTGYTQHIKHVAVRLLLHLSVLVFLSEICNLMLLIFSQGSILLQLTQQSTKIFEDAFDLLNPYQDYLWCS